MTLLKVDWKRIVWQCSLDHVLMEWHQVLEVWIVIQDLQAFLNGMRNSVWTCLNIWLAPLNVFATVLYHILCIFILLESIKWKDDTYFSTTLNSCRLCHPSLIQMTHQGSPDTHSRSQALTDQIPGTWKWWDRWSVHVCQGSLRQNTKKSEPFDTLNPSLTGSIPTLSDRCILTASIDFCGKERSSHSAKSLVTQQKPVSSVRLVVHSIPIDPSRHFLNCTIWI